MTSDLLVQFKSDYGNLLSSVKLARFNKNQFVVSKGDKSNVLIGEFEAEIVNFFFENLSLEEALKKMSSEYQLSLNDGIEVASKCLEKIKVQLDKKPYDYMTWSMELIRYKFFSKWWDIPSFFFKPKIFFTWLIGCVLSIGIIFYFWRVELLHSFDISLVEIFKEQPFILAYLFIINIITSFVHEGGHLFASAPKGKRDISVHFGFYLIFPVFYCDLSHIWSKPKIERIIINLGGVSTGLVLNLGWLVYCFLIDQPMYAILSIMGAYSTLMQLIPFGRSDGYWLLCDIFDQPNLQYRFVQLMKGDIKKGDVSSFVKYYGSINLVLVLGLVIGFTISFFDNFIFTLNKIYEVVIITKAWESLNLEDFYLVSFGFGNFFIMGMFAMSLYKTAKKVYKKKKVVKKEA